MKDFVLVQRDILWALQKSEEHMFTQEEFVSLIVHKKLLKKFIEQKALSIQFQIWEWLWKWKEEMALELVKQLATLWNEILELDVEYEKYKKQIEENKEEEDENKKKIDKYNK